MEFIDDEEISELFSRLLVMLRQAGVDHHSNNYHFVYVASGAQYVKNQGSQRVRPLVSRNTLYY